MNQLCWNAKLKHNFAQYISIDTVVCSFEVEEHLVDVDVELQALFERLFYSEQLIYC